jgi:excisionase family DNA binding protein
MTVKEAATELDLSLWTVWKLCTAGAIASWRADGRILIRPEAVSAFAHDFPLAA